MKDFKLTGLMVYMFSMTFSTGYIYPSYTGVELYIDGTNLQIDYYTLQNFLRCYCDVSVSTFDANVDTNLKVTMATPCSMYTCDIQRARKVCAFTILDYVYSSFNSWVGTITCSYPTWEISRCIGRVSLSPFNSYGGEFFCVEIEWRAWQLPTLSSVNNAIVQVQSCDITCPSIPTSTRRTTTVTRATPVTRVPSTIRASTKASTTTMKRVATTRSSTPRGTPAWHLSTSVAAFRSTPSRPTPPSYSRTSQGLSTVNIADKDKDDGDSNDDNGLIIGLTVFAVAVILAAAAVVYFFYRRRRLSKRASKNRELPSSHFANAGYAVSDNPETVRPAAADPHVHSLMELANKRRQLPPQDNIYTYDESPGIGTNTPPIHNFPDLLAESCTDDMYANENNLVANVRNNQDETYEPIYFIT